MGTIGVHGLSPSVLGEEAPSSMPSTLGHGCCGEMGAGERQLRSTELHSSSCCDSVGTSGDRQAMQWEAAFICLSPRGQEETPWPPSKAWALVQRKRSYQSPFLCCGGAGAQPACVAPASPRATCQPPSNLPAPSTRDIQPF